MRCTMGAPQARAQARHYLGLAHKLDGQPYAEIARNFAMYYAQRAKDLEEPTHELKRASGD